MNRFGEELEWRDLVTKEYKAKAKNDMLDITIYYMYCMALKVYTCEEAARGPKRF
jgi:hypothetical protein